MRALTSCRGDQRQPPCADRCGYGVVDLSVMEHIAVVQRAQAIAATDHGALVRVQRELATAQVELKQLRRWARRRAPTITLRIREVVTRPGRSEPPAVVGREQIAKTKGP
jgi:hypothetical protein